MKRLKEWWAVIVLAAAMCVAMVYIARWNEPFKIHVDGGLFRFSYDVKIPSRFMSQELADRHNEAFLDSIGVLMKSLDKD